MTRDDLRERANRPHENPPTTVYGYALIVAGLQSLRAVEDIPAGADEDIQELTSHLEAFIEPDTETTAFNALNSIQEMDETPEVKPDGY